jgi:hypothetical protein
VFFRETNLRGTDFIPNMSWRSQRSYYDIAQTWPSDDHTDAMLARMQIAIKGCLGQPKMRSMRPLTTVWRPLVLDEGDDSTVSEKSPWTLPSMEACGSAVAWLYPRPLGDQTITSAATMPRQGAENTTKTPAKSGHVRKTGHTRNKSFVSKIKEEEQKEMAKETYDQSRAGSMHLPPEHPPNWRGWDFWEREWEEIRNGRI